MDDPISKMNLLIIVLPTEGFKKLDALGSERLLLVTYRYQYVFFAQIPVRVSCSFQWPARLIRSSYIYRTSNKRTRHRTSKRVARTNGRPILMPRRALPPVLLLVALVHASIHHKSISSGSSIWTCIENIHDASWKTAPSDSCKRACKHPRRTRRGNIHEQAMLVSSRKEDRCFVPRPPGGRIEGARPKVAVAFLIYTS